MNRKSYRRLISAVVLMFGLVCLLAVVQDNVYAKEKNIVFDNNTNQTGEYWYFMQKEDGGIQSISSAVSTDENVCRAVIAQDSDLPEGTIVYGEDFVSGVFGYYAYQLIPTGPGTADITLVAAADSSDKEVLHVTVTADYFQAMLNNQPGDPGDYSFGPFHFTRDTYGPHYYYVTKMRNDDITVLARSGCEVTLQFGSKTIGPKEAGFSWAVIFPYVNLGKAKKTSAKIKIEYNKNGASAMIEHPFTITRAEIHPKKIKAKSKKGTVVFKNLLQGDKVVVKKGSKKLKTAKISYDKKSYTLKFKSKTRLKKKTKLTYLIYNDDGRLIEKRTYKVGKKP